MSCRICGSAKGLIRLRLPRHNAIRDYAFVESMLALFAAKRYEQDEFTRLMFDDARYAPGRRTWRKWGSRCKDVMDLTPRIILEESKRSHRAYRRISDNDVEAERLETGPNSQVAAAEVCRTQWPKLRTLVAVSRTNDRFRVVELSISDKKIPARLLETVSREELVTTDSIEFSQRLKNRFGRCEVSESHGDELTASVQAPRE